jgi:hypothetical protein
MLRPRAARFRVASLAPRADNDPSRIRSRPRTAVLDRRAVDALLNHIGMTWLTTDDRLTPLRKGRDRSVETPIRSQ